MCTYIRIYTHAVRKYTYVLQCILDSDKFSRNYLCKFSWLATFDIFAEIFFVCLSISCYLPSSVPFFAACKCVLQHHSSSENVQVKFLGNLALYSTYAHAVRKYVYTNICTYVHTYTHAVRKYSSTSIIQTLDYPNPRPKDKKTTCSCLGACNPLAYDC